jgi:hypothetical protein
VPGGRNDRPDASAISVRFARHRRSILALEGLRVNRVGLRACQARSGGLRTTNERASCNTPPTQCDLRGWGPTAASDRDDSPKSPLRPGLVGPQATLERPSQNFCARSSSFTAPEHQRAVPRVWADEKQRDDGNHELGSTFAYSRSKSCSVQPVFERERERERVPKTRPSSKNSPEPANHAKSVPGGLTGAGKYFACSVDPQAVQRRARIASPWAAPACPRVRRSVRSDGTRSHADGLRSRASKPSGDHAEHVVRLHPFRMCHGRVDVGTVCERRGLSAGRPMRGGAA